MSAQQNTVLIHEVIEAIFNNQELDRLEEYFTEDLFNHDGPPDAPTGPAAFRACADDEAGISGSPADARVHTVRPRRVAHHYRGAHDRPVVGHPANGQTLPDHGDRYLPAA